MGSGGLTLTGNTVVKRCVSSSTGGAVHVSGGSLIMGGNALVSNNSTTWGNGGGGVYVDSNGRFTMEDHAKVSGNTAPMGGGVHIRSAAPAIFIMKGNAEISGNTSSGSGGGAAVENGAELTMYDTARIHGNTAGGTGRGGGVNLGTASKLTMNDNTLIYGNTAGDHGGGVALVGSSSAVFLMNGGGVAISAIFRISNGMVRDNTAGVDGASLYKWGTVEWGPPGGPWTALPLSGSSGAYHDGPVQAVNGVLIQP